MKYLRYICTTSVLVLTKLSSIENITLDSYQVESHTGDQYVGVPTSKDKPEDTLKWFSLPENQAIILSIVSEKIPNTVEGELALFLIDNALHTYTKTYNKEPYTDLLKVNLHNHGRKCCLDDSDDDEEKNAEKEKLEEEYNEHIANATDSLIRFVGDAAVCGVTVVEGFIPVAAYQAYEASSHLVEACHEYNEATRCKEELEELDNSCNEDFDDEEEYCEKNEEENSEKSSWWPW